MLTIRFEKLSQTIGAPPECTGYVVHQAQAVTVTRRPYNAETVRAPHNEVMLGHGDDSTTLCVGFDEVYKVAYVMNAAGKTVDVIR